MDGVIGDGMAGSWSDVNQGSRPGNNDGVHGLTPAGSIPVLFGPQGAELHQSPESRHGMLILANCDILGTGCRTLSILT